MYKGKLEKQNGVGKIIGVKMKKGKLWKWNTLTNKIEEAWVKIQNFQNPELLKFKF